MTVDLYDALEICLQAQERGADIDACLKLFPDLADELRPILETAAQVRAEPVEIPVAAMRRGRALVLQHAAELREQKRSSNVVFWSKLWQTGRTFRIVGTSLATVVFLFSSGTGLVFASSNSLPGDQLYPVKRSWEGVQLAFIFDPQIKQERENEFEHERVEEIHELFSESRQTQVDFQGKVEIQHPTQWQIAGLQIVLEHDAVIDSNITIGTTVRVIGETEDGVIKAEHIILVETPAITPTPISSTKRPTETAMPQKTPTLRNTETIEPHETEDDVETPEPPENEKEPTKDKDKNDDDNGGHSGGDDGGGGSDD